MEEHHRLVSPCFNNSANLTVYSTYFKCSKIEYNVSTCLPLQTPGEIDTIEALCQAADIIWTTGFWFSVIMGIFGNALAILTIASLPRSTATFLVGLLATSDLVGICIQTTVHFLDKYRMYSRATHYWYVFPMLYDIVASYSNWLLVLICLERYFTIRFPLHKRYYFTLRHSRISAVFLAVAIFIVYNTATWTLGYNNMNMYKVRNVVYAGLPLLLILVTIGLISFQLRRIHEERKTFNGYVHSKVTTPGLGELPRAGTCPRRRSSTPLQEIARIENSVTGMMLVAAVCFSIFTIPNCILLYTYQHSALHWNTPVLRARWQMFQKVCQVLTFLNLSLNFVLYFLSTKKFRAQLFKLLSTKWPNVGRRESQQTLPLNNNSKTEQSHHLVYVEYFTCTTISDRGLLHAQQTSARKGQMTATQPTGLPGCSITDSSPISHEVLRPQIAGVPASNV